MGLTLADGNFGYSRDPVIPQGRQGDPALANLIRDYSGISTTYGSKLGGFKTWFDSQTKNMSVTDKAKAWNDVVGDYSDAYYKTAGQEFLPDQNSISQFISALGNLTPGKDFTGTTLTDVIPGFGTAGGTKTTTGDMVFNPATGTYTRTQSVATDPWFKDPRMSTADRTKYGTVTDTTDNLFDYIMQGKLVGTDTRTNILNSAENAGNKAGLSGIFSGLSTDRLTQGLTEAFRNITGSNVLPAEVLSGIRPGSYDYYKNPGQYDTDYNSMLSNLFNSHSAKSAIDPMYTQAQTKLGFTNNDANRTAFNTSVAKYGLSNVMSDISGYVPTVTNPVVTPPVVDNQVVAGVTTPTPTNPTGATPIGGTPAGNKNYLSTIYPGVSSRTDMNRGSRYFDTNSGQYNQNLSNMYGSNNQPLQQGL